AIDYLFNQTCSITICYGLGAEIGINLFQRTLRDRNWRIWVCFREYLFVLGVGSRKAADHKTDKQGCPDQGSPCKYFAHPGKKGRDHFLLPKAKFRTGGSTVGRHGAIERRGLF